MMQNLQALHCPLGSSGSCGVVDKCYNSLACHKSLWNCTDCLESDVVATEQSVHSTTGEAARHGGAAEAEGGLAL